MIRDEQTHSLPTEAIDRARVAVNMGAADWNTCHALIDAARDRVARQFEALLAGTADAEQGPTEAGADWLASAMRKSTRNSSAAVSRTPRLPSLRRPWGPIRTRHPIGGLDESGRRRLHLILGRVLKSAARRPQAAAVVQRVLRVLEAIGTRSSYLALLTEQPAALNRLIEVCAISGFLSRQIADFPLLLDELIDAKAFDELPSRQSFVLELAARTERLPADDPERQVEALRQFQKVAVFKVALADLTGGCRS